MRNVNLRIIVEILKAFQKGKGQRNLYQLYNKNPRTGSKSTLLKYIRIFVDSGLLEQKDGKIYGNLQEKIYILTEKGKAAQKLSCSLLRMLETNKLNKRNT